MNLSHFLGCIHPRCRCTIAPEVEGTRLAGRKRIPASVGYSEWRQSVEKPLILGNGAANKVGEFNKVAKSDFAKELMIANGDGKGIGRATNCIRCVVAHEARMRSYDVISRPSLGTGDPLRTLEGLLSVFEQPIKIFTLSKEELAGNITAAVENTIKLFGEGARAFVWFDWKKSTDRRGGHIIIAECKQGGIVNIGDPQSKERAAAYKLKDAIPESIKIMRVDNLTFTDRIKRFCMNRSETNDTGAGNKNR